MNVSLDYDNTYTEDKLSWNNFIAYFRSQGHKIFLVTSRHPKHSDEVLNDLCGLVDGIYFTSHEPKDRFMKSHGIQIDVWIDDNPNVICWDRL